MKKLLSTIMALVMLLSLVPMAVATGGATPTAANDVAQIGDQYYATLDDAVSEAADGATIKLLKNAEGAGLWLAAKDAKSITIDFNDFTYTVTTLVGSTGSENQAAHFEKGNTVTMKNGTLKVADSAASSAKILIQNYCNLTVSNMTLDGRNLKLANQDPYTLSNNDGVVKFTDCTVYAAERDNAIAVDAAIWANYNGADVTLENCTVYGKLDVAKYEKVNGKWTKTEDLATKTDGTPCLTVIGGSYTDLNGAVLAAQSGAKITLAGDVALSSPVTVDKDLTIDMNGYDITANGCRALHQKQGTLNIIGKGIIAANGVTDSDLSAIRVGDGSATSSANFTLGKDVTVTSDSCYGITYFGIKDETLTIHGTVAVKGNAPALSGNGSSAGNADVSVTVNATVTAENANAIYKPEKGTLTINGVVKGVGGIEVKSGTLAIGANAEVTATAEETSHSANSNGCSTSGYALAAVANESYQGNVNITVSGGKVIGQVAKVVDDAAAPEGELTIEGGTFTVDPTEFLADKSLIAVPSKGGVYVVQPKEITVGDTTTKVDVSGDGKTVTVTETENKNEGNVATRTETVTVKDNEGNVTKVTETVTTEKTENGGTTTVVTKKDTLNKTETTEVTHVIAPTTASDVTLDVKNTTNVAVNKASMAALTGDTVKDVIIETKDAKLTLNKTAVETMENNVAADGKMTLNVTVTENTAKEVTVKVEAKTQGDKNVFPPETKNTNGEIEITIPYTGTADYLDLWYVTNTSTYMGRFPVVNGYVSFKVTHFSQYNLIPVASSGSSVIKTGAGSSAASTTQTVTTDLTPGSITKVTVDGKVVDAKYYTVSGSNVTFTAEFLKTLKNGSHTVTVENATKIAKGVFTVNNPTTAQSPTTADAGIALYAGMAIASVMGTGVVFTSRKRKNH